MHHHLLDPLAGCHVVEMISRSGIAIEMEESNSSGVACALVAIYECMVRTMPAI
jgi:hypothetical protein